SNFAPGFVSFTTRLRRAPTPIPIDVCCDLLSCCRTRICVFDPMLSVEPSLNDARRRPVCCVLSKSFQSTASLALVGLELRSAEGTNALISPARWLPCGGSDQHGNSEINKQSSKLTQRCMDDLKFTECSLRV